MSNGNDQNTPIQHLTGLAMASVLVAICWWLWERAAWLADVLSAPELRIMIALTGSILVLSLADRLTAPRT